MVMVVTRRVEMLAKNAITDQKKESRARSFNSWLRCLLILSRKMFSQQFSYNLTKEIFYCEVFVNILTLIVFIFCKASVLACSRLSSDCMIFLLLLDMALPTCAETRWKTLITSIMPKIMCINLSKSHLAFL